MILQPLTRGIYSARPALSPQDMASGLALRQTCFRRGQPTSDRDRFDTECQHVLISVGPTVVAGFRTQTFRAASLADGYTAQFYDLTPLQGLQRPMIELGRFCLHPAHADPDILRLAWAVLTRLVDQSGATLLFGCSSFPGADVHKHSAALGYLAQNHLGPDPVRPGKRAPDSLDMRALPCPPQPPALPPLLKTYLAMGGWVADHAVLDHDLNTTHVFTALDVARVPPARARALRAQFG